MKIEDQNNFDDDCQEKTLKRPICEVCHWVEHQWHRHSNDEEISYQKICQENKMEIRMKCSTLRSFLKNIDTNKDLRRTRKNYEYVDTNYTKGTEENSYQLSYWRGKNTKIQTTIQISLINTGPLKQVSVNKAVFVGWNANGLPIHPYDNELVV